MARASRAALPAALARVARRHGGARGFSLIEIVVVLAIVASAALLAATVLSGGFERLQLQACAKQIAANLRYARAQAIATGTPQRFVIDPRAHAWQAPNGRHGDIPQKLAVSFRGAREVQPQAGQGAIVFFADGASTGGGIHLGAGRATWDIDVAWLSGEISLRRNAPAPR